MRLSKSIGLWITVAVLGFSTSVFAGVVVSPVTPYVVDIQNSNLLSLAGTNDGSVVIVDTGYHNFDLRQGYSGTGSTAADMVLFDVTVTGVTVDAGKSLVVIAGVQDSPTTQVVPIAAAQTGIATSDASVPTQCGSGTTSTNVLCSFPVTVGAGPTAANLFQGAKIDAGTTVRVGIFPKDICKKNSGLSGTCTGENLVGPPWGANTPNSLKITFYAVTVTDINGARPTPDTTTPSTYLSAKFFNVSMQIAASDGTGVGNLCQSGGVGGEFTSPPYFPGDSEISVHSYRFRQISQTNSMSVASAIVIAGGESLSGVTTSNYTAASIVARIPITGDTSIGGFINSEPSGTQHPYTLFFAARDSAGIISDFSCNTANTVKTAKILGFLKKNNCFVATGAFHGENSAAIDLLRSFRDQVLSRSSVGTAVRDWYYSWSPRAGWWLLENPEFRLPVLRALLPVEIIAWVFLNPWIATLLGFVAILIILGTLYIRSRSDEGMA